MNSKSTTIFSSGFTGLSIYYAYDLPGALNYALNFTKETSGTKISLLYTAYSAPNIFLPYLFCYTQTYFQHIHLIALSMIATFGQFIFTIGVFLDKFSIMIIGRAVAGIGSESYSVVQNRMISQRFEIEELAGAMTLYNACIKTGTLLTFFITPILAQTLNAFAACVFAFLLSLLGCFSTYDFCTRQNNTDRAINPTEYQLIPIVEDDTQPTGTIPAELNTHKLSLKLIISSHFIFCCAWSSFYSVAPMILQARAHMAINTSSYAVSLLEMVSLVSTAVISYFIGKIGNNLNLSLVGSIAFSLAHFNMIFNENAPLWSMMILGFSSSLLYLYLPCLPKVVDKNRLSMVFAVVCCGANLAYSISPLCVALLTLKDHTYLLVEIYMLVMALGGISVLSVLSYINWSCNLKLNGKFR